MSNQKTCCFCKVTVSPLWRNGPPEHPTLCNACGVRHARRGTLLKKNTQIEAKLSKEIEILYSTNYFDYKKQIKSIKQVLKGMYIPCPKHDEQFQKKNIVNTTNDFAKKYHLQEGYSVARSIAKACELVNIVHQRKVFELPANASYTASDKYEINFTPSEDELQTLFRTLHDVIDKESEATLFRETHMSFWDCLKEILNELTAAQDTVGGSGTIIHLDKQQILIALSRRFILLT